MKHHPLEGLYIQLIVFLKKTIKVLNCDLARDQFAWQNALATINQGKLRLKSASTRNFHFLFIFYFLKLFWKGAQKQLI